LPSKALAFDIGTGTGVLAAVFAKRGVIKVIATDDDPRALDCAAENIARLKLAEPGYLERMASQGQTVKLERGGSQNVTVKVSDPGR